MITCMLKSVAECVTETGLNSFIFWPINRTNQTNRPKQGKAKGQTTLAELLLGRDPFVNSASNFSDGALLQTWQWRKTSQIEPT